MTQLNLGTVRMRLAGDYDPGRVYVPVDIVRDPANGSLYVPKVAQVPAGTALNNTFFFDPLLLTVGFAAANHQHAKADITDFNDSDYAAATHSHAVSDVSGLQAALDGKSETGHGHGISDITNLQTALDGLANDVSGALLSTNNLSDLDDASAARASLGLVPGTAAGQIVQLDGSGALPAVDGSNLTGISAASANDAIITISPGTGLTGGGSFTTDQAGNETINIGLGNDVVRSNSNKDITGLHKHRYDLKETTSSGLSSLSVGTSLRALVLSTRSGGLNINNLISQDGITYTIFIPPTVTSLTTSGLPIAWLTPDGAIPQLPDSGYMVLVLTKVNGTIFGGVGNAG